MVLSDLDIKKAIKNKTISILPFRKELLKPGSYTFCLGQRLFKPVTEGEIDVENTEVLYDEIVISEEGYVIGPGEFLLGQTHETLSIANSICCFLDTKTSLARIGLSVLHSSTFIEPGQTESYETLEILNSSKNPIRIYAGMKVAKGIFMRLSSESEIDYMKVGTYAGQKKPGAKLGKTFR